MTLTPAVVAVALGCSRADEPSAPLQVELGGGIVAVVDGDRVAAETVDRIARAQGVDPAVARAKAVRDALFAALARRDLAGHGIVRSAERSVLARAVLEEIQAQASRRPISDEELSRATARHWLELDRPPSARTSHVVVLVKDAAGVAKAKALAQRIAQRLAEAPDTEAFLEIGKSAPTEGFDVRAEALPAVAADGRVVNLSAPPGVPTRRFDPDYARAANALSEVGQQSGIVRTAFGFHVIRLEERLPEQRSSIAERQSLLRQEIVDERARAQTTEMLAELGRARPVQIARSALELTDRVQVER